MQSVIDQWGESTHPLVLIVIRFNRKGKRVFNLMETHHIQNGNIKKIRSQPALPWEARGKRWEDWS
ncbi:MAG: hypothetical protein ACI9DS_002919 [Glaciecola sp.]|jgi:hypothetical protein